MSDAIGSKNREDVRGELFSFNFGSKKKRKNAPESRVEVEESSSKKKAKVHRKSGLPNQDAAERRERTRSPVLFQMIPEEGETTEEEPAPVEATEDRMKTFVIEEALPKQYLKLKNSNLTQNQVSVLSSFTTNFVSCAGPVGGSMEEEFPGIMVSRSPALVLNDTVGIGFLKLKPKTVRPFAMNMDASTVYFIMKGKVKVRSCGAAYTRETRTGDTFQEFLFSKELQTGQCFVVPASTCYTVENWDTKEALLGYNHIRVPSEDRQSSGY